MYEVDDKVWYKGCAGIIREVFGAEELTEANEDTLYLVSFGEAGSFRLFGSEVEPRK